MIKLSPRIITFFVYFGVSSFRAVALGRLLPSFIDDCICLVWSWSDARELSQLWFPLLILLVELPFMFVLTIFLPFVLLLTGLLPVWKSFLLFSIDFFPPKLLLFFLTWKIKLIYTLLIRCKFMCCSQHFTTYLLSLK